MKTVRIDQIEAIPVVGGELKWRPVRRTLGIGAFGINAYTADAGELVVLVFHRAQRHARVIGARADSRVGILGREVSGGAGALEQSML